MCIDATTDTGRTERLRQHAREFKREHEAHLAAQDTLPGVRYPGLPIAPGWAMARDSEGNAVVVPESRTRERKPRMSPAFSSALVVILLSSISLVSAGLYAIAPYIPKAIDLAAAFLRPAMAALSL